MKKKTDIIGNIALIWSVLILEGILSSMTLILLKTSYCILFNIPLK